ncbi:hypothetical protein PC128_g6591 [Phytophthora cactorum]|nr:hypothetical protein PC128_g6591 [Phytophthora cactorum]
MPRTKKPRLMERERGRIDGLFEAGTSKRGIARALGRSYDTICRALAPTPPPKTRKKAKPLSAAERHQRLLTARSGALCAWRLAVSIRWRS